MCDIFDENEFKLEMRLHLQTTLCLKRKIINIRHLKHLLWALKINMMEISELYVYHL